MSSTPDSAKTVVRKLKPIARAGFETAVCAPVWSILTVGTAWHADSQIALRLLSVCLLSFTPRKCVHLRNHFLIQFVASFILIVRDHQWNTERNWRAGGTENPHCIYVGGGHLCRRWTSMSNVDIYVEGGHLCRRWTSMSKVDIQSKISIRRQLSGHPNQDVGHGHAHGLHARGTRIVGRLLLHLFHHHHHYLLCW